MWTGDECTAFWLAPRDGDTLEINGIMDTLARHKSGEARLAAKQLLEGNSYGNYQNAHNYHGQMLAGLSQSQGSTMYRGSPIAKEWHNHMQNVWPCI